MFQSEFAIAFCCLTSRTKLSTLFHVLPRLEGSTAAYDGALGGHPELHLAALVHRDRVAVLCHRRHGQLLQWVSQLVTRFDAPSTGTLTNVVL